MTTSYLPNPRPARLLLQLDETAAGPLYYVLAAGGSGPVVFRPDRGEASLEGCLRFLKASGYRPKVRGLPWPHGNEFDRYDFLELVKADRAQAKFDGKPDDLQSAINRVCEVLDLCPLCRFGVGRKFYGNDHSGVCTHCNGAGKYLGPWTDPTRK